MFGNTLKTAVLLAGLAGFFVLVGTLLGGPAGTVIGMLLGLARLFLTHPPTVDRVDRLMALHPSIASNRIGVSS